jgi:thiol-disulfide isomerase/thioredoxin
MKYLKKYRSTILFGLFIILMIIPQTRMPIQVFLQRTISFSPSEIEKEDRTVLKDYNWKLSDLNSNNVNLSESKGKVILINFWATWCPPCVAEMPGLQELHDHYKGKVDFYFVTNDNPEKINLFLNNKGYSLPVFRPIEESPNVLASKSLPTTYLISKKGEIIMRKVGAASWNSDKVHKAIDDLLIE